LLALKTVKSRSTQRLGWTGFRNHNLVGQAISTCQIT